MCVAHLHMWVHVESSGQGQAVLSDYAPPCLVFHLNTQPIDLSSLSSQLMKGIPCLHLLLERLITGGLPDLPSFYVGPVNTNSSPRAWCRH